MPARKAMKSHLYDEAELVERDGNEKTRRAQQLNLIKLTVVWEMIFATIMAS
jgi:hypothetical protein